MAWRSPEAFRESCLRSHKAFCTCAGNIDECPGYLNAKPVYVQPETRRRKKARRAS